MTRRQTIAANLEAVEGRIRRACDAAERRREDVQLVVITKTYPASDIEILHGLGVSDVGENRHPEAGRKKEELGDVGRDLVWHFVGGLQSNKAAAVAAYSDVVHSVDRAKLLPGLSKGAHQAGRPLACLVQVNLDPPEADDTSGRAGAGPSDAADLAHAIETTEGLELRGVMGVAPLGGDPATAFAALARIARMLGETHPRCRLISAGMSDDLEQAVAAGATHVRVGRSVLGERPPLR